MFAVVGALPAEAVPVSLGGTPNLLGRWQRFVDTGAPYLHRVEVTDPRVWHFIAGPGLLDDGPVAGVWRMSEARDSRRGLLALLVTGAIPPLGANWFHEAARLLTRSVELRSDSSVVAGRVRTLPPIVPAQPPRAGAVFWIEDWEVHEWHFPTIHDLAADGFAQMLQPRFLSEAG